MSTHESRVVPGPRPLPVKETQLIDRVEEMGPLKEAVDRAILGQGGLVFLRGEAGIGKTRLARELAAYARLRGMQVLSGRCPALFRMDGLPPYILWKEVIKDFMEVCTPGQLYRVIGYYPIEVSKLVPEINQMLGTVPSSFQLSPENSRDRLFEAVSQFITNISREVPLLVILDDLQWTDESSLLLLHYLARGVLKEPLLLLGAYRDADVDEKHPLIPVLTELNRERLLQSVLLRRMSFDDVSEMIRRIFEQDDVPKGFCELVYEKTRGNPFFVEEVVKSLKEEGVIHREENRWTIKEVSEIEFPETVKIIIKKRISQLDDDCQNVLSMASFIEKDFTVEALREVTGFEETRLLGIMEKLLTTGLFKHRVVHGEDQCSFSDVIVRDVVQGEVSPFKRRKLHGVVGCALEKVYVKNVDDHLGELAFHFFEAGDKERALGFFLKAGDKAMRVYANGEAVSYYRSALKLLEEKGEKVRERTHVLEKLGDVERVVGEYGGSLKYWDEALLLSLKFSEKEEAARLHGKMATVFWHDLGNAEKAREHQDEAVRILEEMPENAELARIYSNKAQARWHGGDLAGSLSWAEKALWLSKKLNAFDVMAESYTNMALALCDTGRTEEAIECLEKGLKIALDNGYFETALRIYNNLAQTLPDEQSEKRLSCSEKGYELAKKVGCIRWISRIGITLAYSYSNMGEMTKAVSLVEEAEALNRKTGSLTDLHYSVSTLGVLYQVLGDWDRSERYYEEALKIAKTLDLLPRIAEGYGNLAALRFEEGEYAKAQELYEKANVTYETAGRKPTSQMDIYQELIRTCIELEEVEKAGSLLQRLQEFALETNDRQRTANRDALQAMLLRAEKKWSESVELFEKSLHEFEDLGARQWNIYMFAKLILYEYSRALLERNQEGDKERAGNLLNEALEIFQKMGAKKDVEKTERMIIYLETSRQTTSKAKPIQVLSEGHVATGYAGLDDLLFDGIPWNFAVALTSPPCDERDSLIKSFLETGAKRGEVAFHVTIDAGPGKAIAEEFPSTFYLFLCNPQADAIIKSAPNVFKLKGVENLTDIGIALTSTIRTLDPSLKGTRRICIGLVSDVLLQHHAVQTRRWMTALITELKSMGFTTLAVIDPQMHPPEELHAILGLFEGEISIYEKEDENGSEKYIKIKKMSNHRYLENELHLKKKV